MERSGRTLIGDNVFGVGVVASIIIQPRESRMKKLLILAGLAVGFALSAPASARNYDCSKAGNANKAACKAPAATTVTSHKTTKVTTTKTTSRNYDCTKAGNQNKAACKTVSAPAALITTAPNSTTRCGQYAVLKVQRPRIAPRPSHRPPRASRLPLAPGPRLRSPARLTATQRALVPNAKTAA
jgi:hypothetical protein